MKSRVYASVAISSVAILLGLTTSAQAGPPLICHPFDIGQAKTLPAVDWNQKGSGSYNLKNLTRDTLAILDSSTAVKPSICSGGPSKLIPSFGAIRRSSAVLASRPMSLSGML